MEKKYFLIEKEEKNGDIRECVKCDNYKIALNYLEKNLHDNANYNFQANKNSKYLLTRVVETSEEEKDYFTIKSMTVEKYKMSNSDELKNFFEKEF